MVLRKSRIVLKIIGEMGKLYFVRHGETVWNAENKICGATDSPLTQLGLEQARDLGKAAVEQGIQADLILYSPLSRAKDTAQQIADMTGTPMRAEPRLVEQNFGRYEGTPRNSEEFQLARQQFALGYGGETSLRLAQRIYNLLDELTADPEHVYMLVAHNGIARCVNTYFFEMTNEEYAYFRLKNCEIRRYDF